MTEHADAKRLEAEAEAREDARRCDTMIPVDVGPLETVPSSLLAGGGYRRAFVRDLAARLVVVRAARGGEIDQLACEAAIEVARELYDMTEDDGG